MSLTYAEIPLGVYTDEVDELLRLHPPEQFNYADVWGYASEGIKHLPIPSPPVDVPFEVGKLVWPTSMSRCGVFRTIVTEDLIERIVEALDSTNGPADLVLTDDESGDSRTVSMYMLPTTPLFQVGGESDDGIYTASMLTLVDKRYYLRDRKGSTSTIPEDWSDVFDQIETELGITLEVDAVDGAFDAPPDRWCVYGQPLSVVLDAACNAIGQRLVANLDGTFKTVSYANADTASSTQIAELSKSFGGEYDDDELLKAVPNEIVVQFDDRTSNDNIPYTVTKTLSDLGFSVDGAVNAVHTIYAEIGYDGDNASDCETYAEQIATEWVNWQKANLDVTYAGIVEVDPTGVEDRIEWRYQKDAVLTRIIRPPFQILPNGDYSPPASQPLVRITAKDTGTGEYHNLYTVVEVRITKEDSSTNVDDVDPEIKWTGVVEINDADLSTSDDADPDSGIYTLHTSKTGQRYIIASDGGGGSGGGTGSDWTAALRQEHCLEVSYVNGEGACDCAEEFEPFLLTSGDGEDWTSLETFEWCGVNYTINFNKGDCNGPCASITSVDGTPCCGDAEGTLEEIDILIELHTGDDDECTGTLTRVGDTDVWTGTITCSEEGLDPPDVTVAECSGGGCTSISEELIATFGDSTGCSCIDGATIALSYFGTETVGAGNGYIWAGMGTLCGRSVSAQFKYGRYDGAKQPCLGELSLTDVLTDNTYFRGNSSPSCDPFSLNLGTWIVQTYEWCSGGQFTTTITEA